MPNKKQQAAALAVLMDTVMSAHLRQNLRMKLKVLVSRLELIYLDVALDIFSKTLDKTFVSSEEL